MKRSNEQWLKRFVLFLTTYLASTTVILLLTGTIKIVNNGNILTDGRDRRGNIWKGNTVNYSYNNIVDLFMQAT